MIRVPRGLGLRQEWVKNEKQYRNHFFWAQRKSWEQRAVEVCHARLIERRRCKCARCAFPTTECTHATDLYMTSQCDDVLPNVDIVISTLLYWRSESTRLYIRPAVFSVGITSASAEGGLAVAHRKNGPLSRRDKCHSSRTAESTKHDINPSILPLSRSTPPSVPATPRT